MVYKSSCVPPVHHHHHQLSPNNYQPIELSSYNSSQDDCLLDLLLPCSPDSLSVICSRTGSSARRIHQEHCESMCPLPTQFAAPETLADSLSLVAIEPVTYVHFYSSTCIDSLSAPYTQTGVDFSGDLGQSLQLYNESELYRVAGSVCRVLGASRRSERLFNGQPQLLHLSQSQLDSLEIMVTVGNKVQETSCAWVSQQLHSL